MPSPTAPPPVLPEPTLPAFTDGERKAPSIAWYRTPVPAAELKALHRRSDALGWAQSLGFLAVLGGAFALAVYSARHLPWWATVGAVFVYGTLWHFIVNAAHELGHGAVFQTRWLNRLFLRVFSFVGWHECDFFEQSHTRHHRYTLHPPDDLEVVLPVKLLARRVLRTGLLDWKAAWWLLRHHWYRAHGHFGGEWSLTLFPAHSLEKRAPVVRWARILLAGHGLIAAASLWMGWWIVPVLTLYAPSVGGWLQFLCNNTQHIGLRDNVPDFRLCCRTITLHPVLQFIYWHMNYHTEHHMYAAVPCYRLGRLHALIQHDLPPCAHGLAAVWREIALIQRRQETQPDYQHHRLEPGVPVHAAEARGQVLGVAGAGSAPRS